MPWKAAFEKLFPDDDFNAVADQVMSTRALVKSEIWELVEHTDPAD